MADWWSSYIRQRAGQYGLDPGAVLAVASREGLGGGVGDQGTSFGPFQLHVGGALPAGRGRAWAESRAGIDYALGQIGGVAKGLRGAQAVNAIVRRFERPANPNAEVAGALGSLGRGGAGGGMAPVYAPSGPMQHNTPGSVPQFTPPSQPSIMPFVQGIMGALQSNSGGGMAAVTQALAARRAQTSQWNAQLQSAAATHRQEMSTASAMQTASAAPLTGGGPSSPADMGSKPGPTGKGGIEQSLLNIASQFGLNITSGYRSVAKQADLYAHRSGPGTVAAPGKSYHNYGRAIDVAPNGNLARVVSYVKAHPSQFSEFFYDPLGWYVKNGVIHKGAIGGHSDHAHIAI